VNWNEVSCINLLQISVSAAILILLIAAIRGLAIHRLPKKTFVALWCVVLLRLLVPFSFPLPFGVYTVADKAIAYFATAPAARKVTVFNVPGIGSAPGANTDANKPVITSIAPEAAAQLSPVAAIWIVGMVICALFFIVAHLRCRREYKTALPLANGYINEWLQRQKLRRSIQVRYLDRIGAPMTYGILKPVILFPKTTDWRDKTGLQYVLAHELTHIRRFDILLKWLLAAALCVHWFNPFVWIMYILANRDVELSCDETVLRIFGETAKGAYALTLIHLAGTKSGFLPLCSSFTNNATLERIGAIMKIKHITLMSILLAVTIVTSLTVGAFAAPASHTRADVADVKVEKPLMINPSPGGSAKSSDEEEKLWRERLYREAIAENERFWAEIEKQNRASRAEFCVIYEQYGLTYTKETDKFYYNGELVRYFEDNTATEPGTFSGSVFTQADGDIDIRAVHNSAGKLVGLESYSQADFDARTLKMQGQNGVVSAVSAE